MFKRLAKKVRQMIENWRETSKCESCGGELPFFPTYIDEHNIGVYVCKKCKKEWCFF